LAPTTDRDLLLLSGNLEGLFLETGDGADDEEEENVTVETAASSTPAPHAPSDESHV